MDLGKARRAALWAVVKWHRTPARLGCVGARQTHRALQGPYLCVLPGQLLCLSVYNIYPNKRFMTHRQHCWLCFSPILP